MKIDIRVNGESIAAEVPPEMTLLRFLRERLHLTGTKDGCGTGDCGTCVVLLNGKAVRSCQLKVEEAAGASILTIEGVADDNRLHPLQQAFIEHGAVQCGFCTPGMIMTALGLLNEHPDASREDIMRAMTENRNLCRCTGYVKIIEAIEDAAETMQHKKKPSSAKADPYMVDNPLLPAEAEAMVTGRTQFSDDVLMDGMLHGKLLWAEYPHAEILSLDVTEAENMRGVIAVITAGDIPGKNHVGAVIRDQPAIVAGKVNCIADTLAAVFAESPDIASEAVKRIKVEYRPLKGVFSMEEAALPDAPKVQAKGNLMHHARIYRGDTEAAFKECAAVFEHDYRTPFIEHGFLEPESGFAYREADGTIVIKLCTQAAFDHRTQLAEILAMPEEKIRVVQMATGGAFGGKTDMVFDQYLALGVLKTGRPVKITLTREESLRGHIKRHPARIHFKTGVDAKGHILAVDMKIHLDTGAYASVGFDVLENTLVFGAGPYYVPNVNLEGWLWYTNNIPCGAMRGFGVNQVAVALEQQVDMMARAIKMDPYEFRLLNALEEGLPSASDHIMEKNIVSIKETLQAAREVSGRMPIPSLPGAKIGVGVASAVKNVGFGHGVEESSGAIIELFADGRVKISASQHEYGQGAKAGLAQFVANELGVQVRDIQVIPVDTALTPPAGSTTASRETFMTGRAVIMACDAIKRECTHRAAELLNSDPSRLILKSNKVIDPSSGRTIPLSELGASIREEARYFPPKTHGLLEGEASHFGQDGFYSRRTHWCYAYNSQVAVVAVYPESGEVKVLRIISVNDLGKALNRTAVEGQIHGGVMMGLGFALSEEFIMENGYSLTDTLEKCHLPAADQTPEIVPVILEIPHPFGPEGVKGFAEAPSMATAPAILNAIYDAVGVRIYDLPANKARLLEALRQSAQQRE